MPAVTVFDQTFKGVGEARKYAAQVLNSYVLDDKKKEVRRELSLPHSKFMAVLLGQYHPLYAKRIPVPHKLKRVFARRGKVATKNMLEVECTRARYHLFRIEDCFKDVDKKQRERALSAMRDAVRDHFERFFVCMAESQTGELVCHETRQVLPRDFARVRVVYKKTITFEQIVEKYEQEHGILCEDLSTYNLLGVSKMAEKRCLWKLADSDIEADWVRFHWTHAAFRVISVEQYTKENTPPPPPTQKENTKNKK